MSVSLEWNGTIEQVIVRVNQLPERIKQLVQRLLQRHQALWEAAMKRMARWTDRSGDARQGLFARLEGDDTLVIGHTMSYGIFLEKRWNERYAILRPTLRFMGRKFVADLQQAFA